MKDLDQFLEEMPRREGANAIYIERPLIAYVRVSDVRGDDEKMSAVITVIPTAGMCDDGTQCFKIGAVWNGFSNFFELWRASYVNWSVYFGTEEIEAGLQLAATAAASGTKVELRSMRTALENLQKARMEAAFVSRPPQGGKKGEQ